MDSVRLVQSFIVAIWLTGGGEKVGALVHQGRDIVPPEPKPEGAKLRDCLERSNHLVTKERTTSRQTQSTAPRWRGE